MADFTTPTQVVHPWQATVRTVFAVLVALASLIPVIAVAGGLDTVPAVAQLIAVCGAVTRVLALPGVDDFLSRFLPFLAASR
ncbi:hypothetical protein [Nocardia brasiliensis]|uniref:hypothetical protein n=1 Tax=Nocardia brasiliensis TaxID=37326 RepID=UPI002457BE0D|nr:hypothetical protein [Nocardia brasiliensis]